MKKQLLLVLISFYTVSGFSQLVEGFENTTGPDPLPSTNWTLGSGNWAVFDNGVGAARWSKTSLITTPPSVSEGSNAAYVDAENIGAGNTSEDWLATPALLVPLDGVLRFHTRMGTSGDQGTLFQIYVGPATTYQTDRFAYSLIQEFTESTLTTGSFDQYEEKVVDLSAFAGQYVYIAFVRKYTQPTVSAGGDSWYIDDVSNGDFAALLLHAFIDTNSNGIKDSGEQDFDFGNFVYQINASGTNLYGNTNHGMYSIFDDNPSNSYALSFAVNPALSPYLSSTATYSGITLPVGSGYNYLSFPVTVTTPYNDTGVSINRYWRNPSPGFTYILKIDYTNYGVSNIANGTLTFTKDPNLTITAISQSGTVNTPTGFTYDFINLAPGEHRSIYVTLLVPTIPTVALGQLLTNSVTIQTAGDINSSNDLATLTQAIVGSYDPNDITESHGGKIGMDTFTNNDYLYYTIRFENTGTANAQFIRVEDLLDADLDENTFEMLSASHDVNTLRSGNQLTWHFYDINLPPTISNPAGSHGYIHFKIKPKTGYVAGDIIPNTAQIYFDFNPAIVTNTFDTEFFETLSNASFNGNEFSLYPNPTSDLVSISNSDANDKIASVVIYEISGKIIYTLNKNTLSNISIDVSNFARGLYLVELTSESNIKITKKLLLK